MTIDASADPLYVLLYLGSAVVVGTMAGYFVLYVARHVVDAIRKHRRNRGR